MFNYGNPASKSHNLPLRLNIPKVLCVDGTVSHLPGASDGDPPARLIVRIFRQETNANSGLKSLSARDEFLGRRPATSLFLESFTASPPPRHNPKNLRVLRSSVVLTIRFGLKREGFSGSFGDQRVNRSLAGSQNGGYDLAAQRR